MFEKVNNIDISTQAGPCWWCDENDTCADLTCVVCDGLADDIVG